MILCYNCISYPFPSFFCVSVFLLHITSIQMHMATAYTFSGTDPRTGVDYWSPTMLQVQPPSSKTSRSLRSKTKTRSKEAFAPSRSKNNRRTRTDSGGIITRSRSRKINQKHYRMDFDIDDDDESGTDYDQSSKRKSKHDVRQNTKRYRTPVDKISRQSTPTPVQEISDGESELQFTKPIVDTSLTPPSSPRRKRRERKSNHQLVTTQGRGKNGKGSNREVMVITDREDEGIDKEGDDTEAELKDLLRDLDDNSIGKGSNLPTKDEIFNLSPPSPASRTSSESPTSNSASANEDAHSLLSLSNLSHNTSATLQPSLSTASLSSDPDSSFNQVTTGLADTTITITSSSNRRSNTHALQSQSPQKSQFYAYSNSHSHDRCAPSSSGSASTFTPLLPSITLNHLACEHMSLAPLSKIIQMTMPERHNMIHQQLNYGSVTWQNHRDFFSKRLSTRARGILPSVIGDIIWPEMYEDFANTIKRRFSRNPEPSKRLSYNFSATSSEFETSMFSKKASQLEAKQTQTEKVLHEKLVKALTDNLQQRQTQRNFLLKGEPGCGKSCMVEQVALRMNLPRLPITADIIMSKFVGETEST
jgi:hypothetical protein